MPRVTCWRATRRLPLISHVVVIVVEAHRVFNLKDTCFLVQEVEAGVTAEERLRSSRAGMETRG